MVTSLSFSPDSRQLASVSSDGTLKLWDIVAPPPPAEARPERNAEFSDVVHSSDGTLVVSRFNPISRQETLAPQVGQMKRVAIREVKSGKVLVLLDGSEKSPFTCVAFSPDSRWLVTGHKEGYAALWDVRTGREVRRYTSHTTPIGGICVYPDSRRLITYSGKVLCVWELLTGNLLRTVTGHGYFYNVYLHHSVGRIVSADDDRVRFWDSDSLKLLLEIPRGGAGGFIDVETLVFSHDARYFLNRFYQCDIWDAAGGKRLKRLHDSGGSAGAFSPDGKRLAIVVRSREFKFPITKHLILWEVPSFQRLVSIAIREYPSVWNLEFSADGKRILGLDDNRQPIRSWQ